jgi:hypothetical protein
MYVESVCCACVFTYILPPSPPAPTHPPHSPPPHTLKVLPPRVKDLERSSTIICKQRSKVSNSATPQRQVASNSATSGHYSAYICCIKDTCNIKVIEVVDNQLQTTHPKATAQEKRRARLEREPIEQEQRRASLKRESPSSHYPEHHSFFDEKEITSMHPTTQVLPQPRATTAACDVIPPRCVRMPSEACIPCRFSTIQCRSIQLHLLYKGTKGTMEL